MGQLVDEVSNILTNVDSDKNAKKEYKTERKKILAQIASDERAKTNLVKKNLAAQNAKYGAGGMSGKGMTEEAVLKRMRDETEEPFNEKKRTNQDKLKNLKRDKTGKKNLLKRLLDEIPDFGGGW